MIKEQKKEKGKRQKAKVGNKKPNRKERIGSEGQNKKKS